MKEKFNSSLIQLPDELMPEQHSCMPMNNIKAGGQDEHRSKLDWYFKVEPIERPDFLR
jgi:hypothetical protein